MKEQIEEQTKRYEQIKETGSLEVQEGSRKKIKIMTIIGEIEPHDCLAEKSKTTKYEHILPELAFIEEADEIDGVLFLINTIGGDVECGLAIAEMIASLSKPTVSLVLGGSHSIGVPIAVSTDVSFIVPSGTILVHPVRMSGMIIGVSQTFDYFKSIQDRITEFISNHSQIESKKLEALMLNTGMLTKDLGTVLIGAKAVEVGLVDYVGGLCDAYRKLHQLIDEKNS